MGQDSKLWFVKLITVEKSWSLINHDSEIAMISKLVFVDWIKCLRLSMLFEREKERERKRDRETEREREQLYRWKR